MLRTLVFLGFPGGLDSKESACNVGDLGSMPGVGRSPGEGNSYPLQYSGLENSMDRGAWHATVHGVAKSRTWLRDFQKNKNSKRKTNILVARQEIFGPRLKINIWILKKFLGISLCKVINNVKYLKVLKFWKIET